MFKKLSLLAILLIALEAPSFATHLMGGDLTYKDQGLSGTKRKYLVTLKLYRDNIGGGADLPTAVEIAIYKDAPGNPNIKQRTSVSININPPELPTIVVLPPPPNCPSLEPPSDVEVQEQIYEGTILVDTSSIGYHLIYQNYARNNSIVNLSSMQGILLHAFIPPTDITNSSPAFSNVPIPFFCVNSIESISNTAIDSDGDSLVYSLVTPYDSENINSANPPPAAQFTFPFAGVIYAPGYSVVEPYGAGGSMSINSATGLTTNFSPGNGNFVIAIEVAEYRNGVLISTIRRDMQIIVTACNSNPYPTIDPTSTNNAMVIEEGATTCFPIEFIDPNNDSLSVTYSGELFDLGFTPAPLITGSNRGKGSIINDLCWTAACGTRRALPYSFKATVRDNGCPPVTVLINFTVEVQRPIPPIIDPNTTLCPGIVYTYSTTQRPGSTYQWFVNSGMIQTNSGDSIGVIWNAGTGKLKLVETNQYGCVFDTVFHTVQIRTKPITAINGDSTICLGFNTTLTASPASHTYQWYGGSSSNTPAITVNPVVTTDYVVVPFDNFCYGDSVLKTVVVTNPPPVQIISGSDSICMGSTGILTGSGALNYTWVSQSNISDTLSRNSGYPANPIITTTYILTGTDLNGCIGKDTLKVTVLQLPNVSINASEDSICPSDQTRLAGKGANSYSWYNKLNPGDFISADSVLFANPGITSTYVVTGTDIFGCTNTAENIIVVKPKPADAIISGMPYACPGSGNIPYNILPPVNSLSTFTWFISTGHTISFQNNDSILVGFGSPGMVDIMVQERNEFKCFGNIITYTVEVQEILTPPAPIGPDTICTATATQTYVIPFTNPGAGYSWFVQGGNISSSNGRDSANVTWTTLGVNSGKLWYVETSPGTPPCTWISDTLKVSIFQTPNTSAINGPGSLCIGSSALYSVNSEMSSIYTWNLATGGDIIIGQGTRFIQVDWNSIGNHLLKVVEMSQEGCGAMEKALLVIVNPIPVISANDLIGPAVVCYSNSKKSIYSIRNANNSSRYFWNIQGGDIIKGNGTDSITVSWNSLNELHNLSVYEKSKDSCISQAVTMSIVLDGAAPEISSVSYPSNSNNEIEINWKLSYKLSQLNSYNLYKRKYNSDPSLNSQWTLIASNYYSNNYIDKNIKPQDYPYEYKYSIKDACGDSSISEPHNSMLLKAEGNKVSNNVSLKWNRYNNWSLGAERYEIWRKLDNEVGFSLYEDNSIDTSFESQNGTEGFIHCYKIKAVEKGGNNYSWSNDTCITFNNLINIPTAFSPNGDGVNDTWVIRNIEAYKDAGVEIFNRWGEVVFRSLHYHNEWDGLLNSKSLPDGTYYYVIKLKLNTGDQKESYSGTVTIVK